MSTLHIRNGLIIDGTNTPAFFGDLLIEKGRITHIGQVPSGKYSLEIDATNLVVAPGVIDAHTHTERTVFRNPYSDSKLFQGVTTEIIGQCGEGAYPLPSDPSERDKHHALWEGNLSGSAPDGGPTWGNFTAYKEALEKIQPAVNLLALVPHGILRGQVIGWENRSGTGAELAKMQEILLDSLQAGAAGISFGLEYAPGCYCDIEELVTLAQIVAQENGYCAFHMRSEDDYLLEAIEEVIEVARRTNARVHICHLKADGKQNWGKARQGLELIRKAKQSGLQISVEQYPYDAFSTTLTFLLNSWALVGGRDAMLTRLADPSLRKELEKDITHNMDMRGGPIKILVSQTGTPRPEYRGKNLQELSESFQMTPAQMVIQILLEEKGSAWGVYQSMDPKEVEFILSQPDVAVISDGFGLVLPQDGESFYHPRSFGTFPRVLGHFARDRNILSLELAVYKMTGLVADIVGLQNRGRLQVGMVADLMIFNQKEINGFAGYQQSGPYSQGVVHVIVNGQFALKDGVIQQKRGGQILSKS